MCRRRRRRRRRSVKEFVQNPIGPSCCFLLSQQDSVWQQDGRRRSVYRILHMRGKTPLNLSQHSLSRRLHSRSAAGLSILGHPRTGLDPIAEPASNRSIRVIRKRRPELPLWAGARHALYWRRHRATASCTCLSSCRWFPLFLSLLILKLPRRKPIPSRHSPALDLVAAVYYNLVPRSPVRLSSLPRP